MLDEFVKEIQTEFPNFKIVYKTNSSFMKAINAFLFVITFGSMKAFMETYTTTIGYTAYVPTKWDSWEETNRIIILRHERVHMRQRKRYSMPLFAFLYLIPFFPLFLAYGRARFEFEAYQETIRVNIQFYGTARVLSKEFQSFLMEQFTTSSYGWMWPFKGQVTKWVSDAVNQAVDDYAKGTKS